jgi:hypothetical protein
MQFVREVLGLEKIRDAVESVVVDQDRAEQRLLGFDVLRRGALLRFGSARFEPAWKLLDGRHFASCLILEERERRPRKDTRFVYST